jgi:hypothetical protein
MDTRRFAMDRRDSDVLVHCASLKPTNQMRADGYGRQCAGVAGHLPALRDG